MIGDDDTGFLHFFPRDRDSEYRDREEPDEHHLDYLRRKMVKEQIEGRGVRDPNVLEAMRTVPRHKFVPERSPTSAYEDRPLPIGQNQTISQPYIVAFMTEALSPNPSSRVLEVGTGSGYQTAVLAEVAGEVYTIERHEELLAEAKERLNDLGCDNIHYKVGDGTLGWEAQSPFDRIIVTAGAPEVPDSLVEQLAPDGGVIVLPVGSSLGQDLIRIELEEGEPKRTDLGSCSFVKLVGEEGW